MNRCGSQSIGWLFCLLAAIALGGGCGDGSSSSQRATAINAQPSPEESFDLIFQTFRRGIETGANGVPGSFVSSDAGSRSSLTVNNSVSHELVPPTADDEPYRAKITVVSHSAYSMVRTEDGTEVEEDPKKQNTRSRFGDEESVDGGVNILDPSLVSTPKRPTGERVEEDATTDPVARRSDTKERTYELVYQDGRWRLLTKLDEETERAVKSAFDRALQTQT